MVSKEKGSSRNINFVVAEADREKLEAVCARLALSKSEVCRRALRLGLARFEKVTIPGSAEAR